MTELSILFVNYNSWHVLIAALESLVTHPPRGSEGRRIEFELIVVDNASPLRDDAAEARVRELIGDRGQYIAHDENGGYAKG